MEITGGVRDAEKVCREEGRGEKKAGWCTKQEVGRRGKEGRRRHVCRSMIYRLHCRHGDFCQPLSLFRSKVVVQTAVPRSGGDAEDGEAEKGR